MQTLLKTLFEYLKTNQGEKPTGEACKHLYSICPEYRKLIKNLGGIRKLMYHTPSIEFIMPNSGGNNYLQIATDHREQYSTPTD